MREAISIATALYQIWPRRKKLRAQRGATLAAVWLYVISGKMRLILGGLDLVLGVGEIAEFDTRVPHWFGSTVEEPAAVLSLFGRQGERMHVRARFGHASSG